MLRCGLHLKYVRVMCYAVRISKNNPSKIHGGGGGVKHRTFACVSGIGRIRKKQFKPRI